MTSPATASGSCMCDNASVVINCASSSSPSDIESRNNNDEKLTSSMNCSSHVTAEKEEAVEGAMELKSVKPYKTQDEYLYAMREDLAEWFNGLYDLQMTSDTFFEALDTGIVLCQHANNVRDFIAKWLEKRRSASVPVPVAGGEDDEEKVEAAVSLQKKVTFMTRVKAGSFQARDNLVNFLTWCRFIGVPEVLLFETSDLVLRRNERNVILCLLEVARRGVRYGVPAPTLIQMEVEIDRELHEMQEDEEKEQGEELIDQLDKTAVNQSSEEMCTIEVHRRLASRIARRSASAASLGGQSNEAKSRSLAGNVKVDNDSAASATGLQKVTNNLMSLDEMVRALVSQCTCPQQFPMVKVGEGKYMIGQSLTLIFVRILRNHVMVRIGGGWDTLENYLDRHDPCRCKVPDHTKGQRDSSQRRSKTPALASLSVAAVSASPQPPSSKVTITGQPAVLTTSNTSQPFPHPAADVTDSSTSVDVISQLSPEAVVTGNSCETSSPRQQTTPGESQSAARSRPAVKAHQGIAKKSSLPPSNSQPLTPSPAGNQLSNSTSPSKTKRTFEMTSSATTSRGRQPMRPSSPSILPVPSTPAGGGGGVTGGRRLTTNMRSKSVDLAATQRLKCVESSVIPASKDLDRIMITRDSSGRHSVGLDTSITSSQSLRQASTDAAVTQRQQLVTQKSLDSSIVASKAGQKGPLRAKISLLPDKPKLSRHAPAAQPATPVSTSTPTEIPPVASSSALLPVAAVDAGENRVVDDVESVSSMSVPPADEELNRRMEELFEEYRRAELGLNGPPVPDVKPVNKPSPSPAVTVATFTTQPQSRMRRYSLDIGKQRKALTDGKPAITSPSGNTGSGVMTSLAGNGSVTTPRKPVQASTVIKKADTQNSLSKTANNSSLTVSARRFSMSTTNLSRSSPSTGASVNAQGQGSNRRTGEMSLASVGVISYARSKSLSSRVTDASPPVNQTAVGVAKRVGSPSPVQVSNPSVKVDQQPNVIQNGAIHKTPATTVKQVEHSHVNSFQDSPAATNEIAAITSSCKLAASEKAEAGDVVADSPSSVSAVANGTSSLESVNTICGGDSDAVQSKSFPTEVESLAPNIVKMDFVSTSIKPNSNSETSPFDCHVSFDGVWCKDGSTVPAVPTVTTAAAAETDTKLMIKSSSSSSFDKDLMISPATAAISATPPSRSRPRSAIVAVVTTSSATTKTTTQEPVAVETLAVARRRSATPVRVNVKAATAITRAAVVGNTSLADRSSMGVLSASRPTNQKSVPSPSTANQKSVPNKSQERPQVSAASESPAAAWDAWVEMMRPASSVQPQQPAGGEEGRAVEEGTGRETPRPRRDTRHDLPTRIPGPSSNPLNPNLLLTDDKNSASSLKRCDSGVDISTV